MLYCAQAPLNPVLQPAAQFDQLHPQPQHRPLISQLCRRNPHPRQRPVTQQHGQTASILGVGFIPPPHPLLGLAGMGQAGVVAGRLHLIH
jgi:hypothetical protein